jgi:hypothetical protein
MARMFVPRMASLQCKKPKWLSDSNNEKCGSNSILSRSVIPSKKKY